MNLARGLEQRLEKLADGASASVFRGRMHPIDMASRLVRQLEFLVNPADIDKSLDRNQLVRELTNVVAESAAERGWRLVGDVVIQITTSPDVPRGILEVEGTNSVSSTSPWGQLIADDGSAILAISLNRSLIGRALDSDIRVANQEVSRHHVIMYRQDGATMIQDLGSANGTYLNGVRLTEEPAPIHGGDTLMLGDLAFTYRPIF